jgi:putative copper export protein
VSDVYATILLLHLIGATIWTGGHIVLACVVLPGVLRNRSPQELLRFEAGFERIGLPALLTQVATGAWLAAARLPPSGWLDLANPVARPIALKLALLALTVALAADARLRLIPTLTPERLGALAWHIVPVTVVSVLFVVAGVSMRGGWPG